MRIGIAITFCQSGLTIWQYLGIGTVFDIILLYIGRRHNNKIKYAYGNNR